MSRIVAIKRKGYSYGFELKDEGKAYKKYALVIKVTPDLIKPEELKVGDKVVRINDDKVAGKIFSAVKLLIRGSPNDCCKLEILNESDEEALNSLSPINSFILANSKPTSIIRPGYTKEKVNFFQDYNLQNPNTPPNQPVTNNALVTPSSSQNKNSFHIKRTRSRSYDIDMDYKISQFTPLRSSIKASSKSCLIRRKSIEHLKSLKVRQKLCQDNQISVQKPIKINDLELSEIMPPPKLPNNTLDLQKPRLSSRMHSLTEHEEDIQVALPCEDIFIAKSEVPKIDIEKSQEALLSDDIVISQNPSPTSNLPSPHFYLQQPAPLSRQKAIVEPSITTDAISSSLLPTLNLSKSSNDLANENGDTVDETRPQFLFKTPLSASMRDISNVPGGDQSLVKSLWKPFKISASIIFPFRKQESIIKSIPVKLRVLHFYEKLKSKKWHEYVIEEGEASDTSVSFRMRNNNSKKYSKYCEFVINQKDVIEFGPVNEQSSSTTSLVSYKKNSSNNLQQRNNSSSHEVNHPIQTPITINTNYNLTTNYKHIQLKFYFHSSVFHDTNAMKSAYDEFVRIITRLYPRHLSTQSEKLSIFNTDNKSLINGLENAPISTLNPDEISVHSHDNILSNKMATDNQVTNKKSSHSSQLPFDSRYSSCQNYSTNGSVGSINNRKFSTATSTRSDSKSSFENISTSDIPVAVKDCGSTSSGTSNIPSTTTAVTTNTASCTSVNPTVAPASKNIIKRYIEKGLPKVLVFTGTAYEYNKFKNQLEKGETPLEMQDNDIGTHSQKFIHEVPMIKNIPGYSKLPMIIYVCVKIVEELGLTTDGIYRKSGNQRVVKSLLTNINKPLEQIDPDSADWNNVHAICGLLKNFLRKLKEYLIPSNLSPFLAISTKALDPSSPQSLARCLMDLRYHLGVYRSLREQTSATPLLASDEKDYYECRMQTLHFLLIHLHKVASYQSCNQMNLEALALCFSPVVMEAWYLSTDDVKDNNDFITKAMEILILHHDWIFSDLNPETDKNRHAELKDSAILYAEEYVKRMEAGETIETLDSEAVRMQQNKDEDSQQDIDARPIVKKALSQIADESEPKRKVERRHSSHSVFNTDTIQESTLNSLLQPKTPIITKTTTTTLTTLDTVDMRDKSPTITTTTTTTTTTRKSVLHDSNFSKSLAVKDSFVTRRSGTSRGLSWRSSQTADALDLSYCASLIRHVSTITGVCGVETAGMVTSADISQMGNRRGRMTFDSINNSSTPTLQPISSHSNEESEIPISNLNETDDSEDVFSRL